MDIWRWRCRWDYILFAWELSQTLSRAQTLRGEIKAVDANENLKLVAGDYYQPFRNKTYNLNQVDYQFCMHK